MMDEHGTEPGTTRGITFAHAQRNVLSRGGWSLYEGHRRRVTSLLLSAATGTESSLCVLGAGNCNDLDLNGLASTFATIHLVDLDSEALAFALRQQNIDDPRRFILHGGIDVTGVYDRLCFVSSPPGPPAACGQEFLNHKDTKTQSQRLSKPERSSAGEQQAGYVSELLDACVRDALTWQPPFPNGPFDVMASIGLLSQLIDSVVMTLGSGHPRFLELVQNLRLRHLRLLMERTTPGGSAFLLTEVVSSDTYPQLASTEESDLPYLLPRLIQVGNFFTGLNPAVLRSLCETDPQLAARVERVEILPPWKWQFLSRIYAVVALRLQSREWRVENGESRERGFAFGA